MLTPITMFAVLLAGCCGDTTDVGQYVSYNITAPTTDQLELLDRCTEADDCDAICTEALETAEGYDETYQYYACDVIRTPTGARVHLYYDLGPDYAC